MNRHRRRRSNKNKKDYDLLPYRIILAATNGDPDAINAVLRHYDHYIIRASMRKLYDKYGNVYLFVDEAMRRRLEIKLITGILAFQAA